MKKKPKHYGVTANLLEKMGFDFFEEHGAWGLERDGCIVFAPLDQDLRQVVDNIYTFGFDIGKKHTQKSIRNVLGVSDSNCRVF